MSGTGEGRSAAEDADPPRQPPVPSASRPLTRRAVRWTGYGIAALVCTFALAYLLLVPAADWLAQHDMGNAAGETLETARNNARGSILTLTAALAGFGALAFTARNFTLQLRAQELAQRTFEENTKQAQRTQELAQRTFEESAKQAQRNLELSEQGQVTDRYIKAIEKLGNAQISVRVGAIYALERIARDSERDRSTIMEVLTAFLHQHAEKTREDEGSPVLADIRAAAVVVGRRDVVSYAPLDIELSRTNLQGIRIPGSHFSDAFLSGAKLSGADLTGAKLSGAKLSGADLTGAKLTGAYLDGADLTDAKLTRTNLTRADLTAARLKGSNLGGADLADADLSSADMSTADLEGAHLNEADLTGAHMTGADLADAGLIGADLTGADLEGAHLNEADLTGAKLGRAFLNGAHLSGAFLTGVDLSGADLTDADLTDADLTDADLTDADLSGSKLNDAGLTGARLNHSHLGSADLTGAWREESDPPVPGWVRNSDGKLQREAG